MSNLDIFIDTPIGALFFVCGAISVFVILAILILKKGTDNHKVLGYVCFFGLSFTNYAAAMAYYEGYLPHLAVVFTIPISTISMILGLLAIIPKRKTKFRISLHILSMIISTVTVIFGVVINWYHFTVSALDIFSWGDFRAILVLAAPFFGIGVLLLIHFLSQSSIYFSAHKLRNMKIIKKVDSKEITARVETQVIYQEEPSTNQALGAQNNH